MVVDGSTYGDAVGCNMFSFPTRQIQQLGQNALL